MGRKHGQAVNTKVTKGNPLKSAEQGVTGKRHRSRSQTSGIGKRDLPISKPGFSLYSDSESDLTAKKTKVKHPRPTTQKHATEKVEKQEMEVVSQMQVEAERMKAGQTSGIVIPTGDYESQENQTLIGNSDLPEVSTPFNKRLVSSTPDPERLLEAALLEQQRLTARSGLDSGQSQPSERSPQMIPERDIGGSVVAPDILFSVASGLSEKLKQQRQQYDKYQLQQQQNNHHPQQHLEPDRPQWQHHLQPYQQNMPNFKQLGLIGPFQTDSEPPQDPEQSHSPPLTVTKAEWVDGASDLAESRGIKAAPISSKRSDQDPLRENETSSMYYSFGVTSSKAATNADGVHVPSVTRTGNAAPKDLSKSQGPNAPLFHKPTILSQRQTNEQYQQYASSKQPIIKSKSSSNDLSTSVKPVTKSDTADIKSLTLSPEKSRSAFSKPAKSVVVDKLQTRKTDETTPLPNAKVSIAHSVEDTASSKVTLPAHSVKMQPPRKVAPQKDRIAPQIHGKAAPSSSAKGKKIIHAGLDERGEDVPPNTESTEPPGGPAIGLPSVLEQRVSPLESRQERIPAEQDLNDTADTCDIEVSQVNSRSKNSDESQQQEKSKGLKMGSCVDSQGVASRASSVSDTKDLSQMIEFLKADTYKEASKPPRVDDSGVSEGSVNNVPSEDDKAIRPSEDDKAINIPKNTPFAKDKDTNNSQALLELMNCYLPKPNKDMNLNNNASVDQSGSHVGDIRGEDDSKCSKTLEVNVNQNHQSDDDDDDGSYRGPTSRRPKSLHYLENNADPMLRDIACKLALKATALRDVELRDLIDDMIFHTDAALGREDVRFQSSQMFLAEENSKLKKRLQSVNRQLEAKERQERMGANALGISNNEILQLERKNMYLRQEKDRLDSQVTSLLEEKAKWLITQQDLVRTISLKDHEILKLGEKHHEEKKALHQSLEHATKNSQGVHYKLSVADREISNLEQRLKCKDIEIGDLKEKMKEMETSLMACEAHSLKKDQEMMRLQDLVDTLKIGVDHVLQAYESSSAQQTATANQRQGIENLRQMVHPEEYRTSSTSDPMADARVVRILGPHDSPGSLPSRRTYPQKEGPHIPLTHRALEEHNRRLSPVDRSLWRSLDDGPVMPPITGEEPYYSDSEIEVNGRGNRRRSLHRYQDDNLRRRYGSADRQRLAFDNQNLRSSYGYQANGFQHKGYISRSGGPTERKRRKSEGDKYRHDEEEEAVRMQNYHDDEELQEVPIQAEEHSVADGEDTRYSVTDYFRQYPHMPHHREYPRTSQQKVQHAQHGFDKNGEQRDSHSTQYSTLRSENLSDFPTGSQKSKSTLRSEAHPSFQKSHHVSQAGVYAQPKQHHVDSQWHSPHRAANGTVLSANGTVLSKSLPLYHHSDTHGSDRNLRSQSYDERYSSTHGPKYSFGKSTDGDFREPPTCFTSLRPQQDPDKLSQGYQHPAHLMRFAHNDHGTETLLPSSSAICRPENEFLQARHQHKDQHYLEKFSHANHRAETQSPTRFTGLRPDQDPDKFLEAHHKDRDLHHSERPSHVDHRAKIPPPPTHFATLRSEQDPDKFSQDIDPRSERLSRADYRAETHPSTRFTMFRPEQDPDKISESRHKDRDPHHTKILPHADHRVETQSPTRFTSLRPDQDPDRFSQACHHDRDPHHSERFSHEVNKAEPQSRTHFTTLRRDQDPDRLLQAHHTDPELHHAREFSQAAHRTETQPPARFTSLRPDQDPDRFSQAHHHDRDPHYSERFSQAAHRAATQSPTRFASIRPKQDPDKFSQVHHRDRDPHHSEEQPLTHFTTVRPEQDPDRLSQVSHHDQEPQNSRELSQADHAAGKQPLTRFTTHGPEQDPDRFSQAHHHDRDSHQHYCHCQHPSHDYNTLSDQESHKGLSDAELNRSGPSHHHHCHHHHSSTEGDQGRPGFRGTVQTPSDSTPSNFFNGRSTLPTQSSPIHTSDISVSRRATRGSDNENLTQREFFQGTELSASLSSISDDGNAFASLNNNQLNSLDEDPFSSGLATLDAKIAALRRKIDRTKAMFS